MVVYGDTKDQSRLWNASFTPSRIAWRGISWPRTSSCTWICCLLDDFVRGNNAAFHRTIGRSPDSVRHANAPELWHRMYDKNMKPSAPDFGTGTPRCNWARRSKRLKRGHTPDWTKEVSVKALRIPTDYKIQERDENDVYRGVVNVKAGETFPIDSIMQQRPNGCKTN